MIKPITWPADVYKQPRPLSFRRTLDIERILELRFNTTAGVWTLSLRDLSRALIGTRVLEPSSDLFAWERTWRPDTAPLGRLMVSRSDGGTSPAGRDDLMNRLFTMTYDTEL